MLLPSLVKNKRMNKGFTFIELLIVIGVMTVLATVIVVEWNPVQRFKNSRDVRRTTDVETILSAIHLYSIDNKSTYPSGLSVGMSEKQLGTATSGCTNASAGCSVAATGDCVDLTTPLVKYLKTVPVDPHDGTDALTKYSVSVDSNGIVTVKACGAEGTSNISLSR